MHLALVARIALVVLATCSLTVARQEVVTLAGQVEVVRLVDLAAARMHLSIDYDAQALKAAGSLTLRAPENMTDEELWLLVNRVLASRGLTTVRMEGAYSVVKLADAPGLAVPESSPLTTPVPGFRSVVVRAKHRSVKDVVETLGKVLTKTGGASAGTSATSIGDAGLILISDLSPRVDQALEILKLVDVPSGAPLVEEVAVHHLGAVPLITLVNQVVTKRDLMTGVKTPGELLPGADGATVLLLAPPDKTAFWKELIASLDRRESSTTMTYTPKVFSAKEVGRIIDQMMGQRPDDRWKLVIDELTNALIITATPSQHDQVRALLDRLDAVPSTARRPVRSFLIKNRPVREIQGVLDQLVQSGVLAADTAAPATNGTSAWPPTAPATPTPTPTAAPTPAPTPTPATTPTPALSGATPSAATSAPFTAQSPLVTSLRLPGGSGPRNADLTLSSDEGTNTLIAMGEPRLLSQIELLLVTLDVRQPQVMLEVLIISLSESQTLDLGIELEKLGGGDTRYRISSLFGLGTRSAGGDRAVGDGLGLTGIILNPGDFSIVLRALQTLNRGRSLSMPRLLVTNNQQAMLDSVLEQPFASTNASNTVTTTSFGGTKPAGTQLTLKPQIGGDHLLLEYSVSLSAFIGAAANASLPPPRQENKVQSAASLPDGHTVVVGGIELTSEGKSNSQVPGLGAIPVLGELFKTRSNTGSRSRFYIFIRANILRAKGYEDLKYTGEMMAHQVGIEDGWPVVEPRVIR